MKKALSILLIFSICLASCKKEDDDNNRSSSSSSSGPGDYMFSIKIGGVTHKVQGTYPSNIGGFITNYCSVQITPNSTQITAALGDKSASSYVSGEVFSIGLSFSNLTLGTSEATLIFLNSNNFILPNNLMPGYTGSIDTTTSNTAYPIINVNITDLGSETIPNLTDPNNYYNFGNPIRGSFYGNIYGSDGTYITPSSSNSSYGYVYNIPIPIEIEFIATRLN